MNWDKIQQPWQQGIILEQRTLALINKEQELEVEGHRTVLSSLELQHLFLVHA